MRTFILLVAVIAAMIGTVSAINTYNIINDNLLPGNYIVISVSGSDYTRLESGDVIVKGSFKQVSHLDEYGPKALSGIISRVEYAYDSDDYLNNAEELASIADVIYGGANDTGVVVYPVYQYNTTRGIVLAAPDDTGTLYVEIYDETYLPMYLELFGVSDKHEIDYIPALAVPIIVELSDEEIAEIKTEIEAEGLNYSLETGSAYIATEGLHLNHDTIYYGPMPEYETGYQEYGFENTTVIGEVHVAQKGSSAITHSDMYNDVLVANGSVYVQVSKEPNNNGYYTIDYMQDENTRAEVTVLPQYLEYVLSQYVTGSDVDSHFLG